MSKYYEFCEDLFQNWNKNKKHLIEEYGKDFQLEYVPEPYLNYVEGSNPLFMLNNNPGTGMKFQKLENKAYKSFKAIAIEFWKYYRTPEFKKIAPQAYRRNEKCIEASIRLKYNDVVNVETIPFHSNTLNKARAIKYLTSNELIRQYRESLSCFLSDKPVIVVSAVGTRHSIDKKVLKGNAWIMLQCEIIGFDVEKSKMVKITAKGDKITSARFQYKDKHIVTTMGSNNIPNNAF